MHGVKIVKSRITHINIMTKCNGVVDKLRVGYLSGRPPGSVPAVEIGGLPVHVGVRP